jgi:hypothetical protein
MNRRLAGEDFYFLQELAKTGQVDVVSSAAVYPSARPSARVPFGTGPRVAELMASEGQLKVYNPRTYAVLRAWLKELETEIDRPADALLRAAARISPHLPAFLEANQFGRHWEAIRRQAATVTHLRRQCHRWFDAFRTLKLIHHLRDAASPNLELPDALRELRNAGEPTLAALPEAILEPAQRESLLAALRQAAKKPAHLGMPHRAGRPGREGGNRT